MLSPALDGALDVRTCVIDRSHRLRARARDLKPGAQHGLVAAASADIRGQAWTRSTAGMRDGGTLLSP
eukprot:364705-Chlamydomonas_euryale.AAC.3